MWMATCYSQPQPPTTLSRVATPLRTKETNMETLHLLLVVAALVGIALISFFAGKRAGSTLLKAKLEHAVKAAEAYAIAEAKEAAEKVKVAAVSAAKDTAEHVTQQAKVAAKSEVNRALTKAKKKGRSRAKKPLTPAQKGK